MRQISKQMSLPVVALEDKVWSHNPATSVKKGLNNHAFPHVGIYCTVSISYSKVVILEMQTVTLLFVVFFLPICVHARMCEAMTWPVNGSHHKKQA